MDKNKKGGAMNDFDFEELDKAVNSLAAKTKTENNLPVTGASSQVSITPASRRSAPAPSTGATSVSVSSTPPPSPRAAALPPKEDAAPPTAPAPTVQHAKRLSVAPPKRRGAFMDIVAPANKSATRRTGQTIQPISPSVDAKPVMETHVPEPPAPESPQPLSEPKPADATAAKQKNIEDHAPEIMANTVQAPEPEQITKPKEPASSDSKEPAWPDPLDFHGVDDEVHKPQDTHRDEPVAEEKPASTSPFLPEAKVEKRPLGAFSGFTPKPTPDESSSALDNAPELKSEDEMTPGDDGTFTEPETPKAPTMHDALKTQKPSRDEAESEVSKPDVHGAAMMSIPKQYHTKEKPADTATRPVFDTKEYHPPLLEAAVHEHRGGSSMWSKLFIALATLVLLGVAGYFAYLYFVQQ